MRHTCLLVPLGVLLMPGEIIAVQVPGERFFLSGCEAGQPVVAVVNLWDGPRRQRVVGQLPGLSNDDDRCRGSIVVVRAVEQWQGRWYYEIEDVETLTRGWVSQLFIGARAPPEVCRHRFLGNPGAIARCRGDDAAP